MKWNRVPTLCNDRTVFDVSICVCQVHVGIAKIMKILEHNVTIMKNHKHHRNTYENNENHENLRNPFENHDNHETMQIHLKIIEIMKIVTTQLRITKVMKIIEIM